MPFGLPWRQGQHRILAVQRLDLGFLVHTKHGRMLRWIQRELDDVRGFCFAVWVVRCHRALQPMRLEPMLHSDARHLHVANPEPGCQLVGAPMRRAVSRRPPRRRQDASCCLRGVSQAHVPAIATVQPDQSFSGKSLAPVRDNAAATPHRVTHSSPGLLLRQKQNHAGAPSGFSTSCPAPRSSCEFHLFSFCQNHRVLHEHEYSL